MTLRSDTCEVLRFPEGFVWGSGISAHQVEGDNRNSDWWVFENEGKVANGERSGLACDHYRRYAEDFTRAARLGHKAVKISIEWARVEPERGRYDEVALGHYVDVVRSMRDEGIEPFVTLHHFTSPQWLGAFGWWEGTHTPESFAEYVRVVAERLAPHVCVWITVNEPMLLASAGYVYGIWPPERRGYRRGMRVARNLVRAHRLAYEAIHAADPDCVVGPAVNVTALKHPGKPTLRDRLFGGLLDWVANRYFLERVQDRCDFIGVQYYSRATVQQMLSGDPLAIPSGMRRLPKTDLGWEIYPKGLYHTVRNTWRAFGLPIYVTENGLADAADTKRASFIADHLRWLHRAIQEGADVRGYLYWSLMDNFEWREGFGPRFGLMAVDYETQTRTIRESARFYERVCRENAVPRTGRTW